jgi:hypothetical protein
MTSLQGAGGPNAVDTAVSAAFIFKVLLKAGTELGGEEAEKAKGTGKLRSPRGVARDAGTEAPR